MLGLRTVWDHFHLWLKIGLYLPIEPEIAGPITPPDGGEGLPFIVGLPLVTDRYLPKMNEIRQTIWPQSTHFTKLGPMGTLWPITPHSVGDQAQIRKASFLYQGICLCQISSRLLNVGLYFPIEAKISGPQNCPSGDEESPLRWGLLLFRVRYLPKMNSISSRVWQGITVVRNERTHIFATAWADR